TLKSNFSLVQSRHTLRAGFDMSQFYANAFTPGSTSGTFSFSNLYTRRNDDTLTPAGDLGHSWAAFIMGLPNVMQVDSNDSVALHSPYFGWYVQDGWRLTPRLTVNAGLRLEFELGGTERYNRFIGPFDLTAKLPISDAAVAAYAKAPLPERP